MTVGGTSPDTSDLTGDGTPCVEDTRGGGVCHHETEGFQISLFPELQINDESDLWDFLEKWVGTIPDQTHNGRSIFFPSNIHDANWSPRLLYFPDEPKGHTISPTTAKAIQEFYQSLARAYAFFLYKEPNATLLHAEDKQAIEFRALVVNGSSGIELPPDAINKIIDGLLSKMSGEQELIGLIVFLLLFFGSSIARDFINKRYNAKRDTTTSEERVSLSAQETHRVALIAGTISHKPELLPLLETSEQSKEALVRSAVKVDRSQIMGTEIDSEVAQTILSKRREKGEGKRLEGRFEFIWIGNEHEGGFIGRVREFPSNRVFSVEINYMDLTEDDRRAVFDSLEKKEIINAHINAWFTGDKIVRAVVMKADPT